MRFGVLTGGGDCPGLNAVIRAIIRKGERVFGDEIIGFVDAWEGVMSRRTLPITVETMRGTLPRGGTVLGTTRGSPLDSPDGVDRVRSTISEMGIDGLIIIGGNGSLTVGEILFREHGIPVLGVPKTIDNDIEGTDLTFGFNTAVQIATDAIDRLHTTAESHDRVMVVEVMGRHSGWIATHAGLAGGAAVVLIPELPFDIDEVCERLVRRHSRGRFASIVVVAEGSRPAEGTIDVPDQIRDEYGHIRLGGIGSIVAAEIGLRTGFETRPVLLGHVQRGGTPTAFDRVLSTRFGVAAVDAAREGKWGSMVALRDNNIVTGQSTTGPVLVLVSGGGSALLPAPAGNITLEDKAEVSRLLLASGANIRTMNLLRQQLSLIKGGGLARLCAGRDLRALILSDVVGDDLSTIASGPTVAPLGTRADAIAVLERLNIWDRVAQSVRDWLTRSDADQPIAEAQNILIGSNAQSVAAMAAEAGVAHVSPDAIEGDVADAAREICDAAGEGITIWGGETTVTLKGTGRGGRNQELALRIAIEAQARGWTNWTCLQGGSDGRDGPTDAAGGLVDEGTLARIAAAGGDLAALLDNNDSYAALGLAGDLLMTGGTGTNVADLGVLIR